MTRILLTGATGLIGSAVVARLSDQHELWCLGRTAPSTRNRAVRWTQWDLSAPGVPDSLPNSIDAVIHLAQSDAYKDFPRRAKDIFQVNLAGTAWLLDWACAAGAKHFVLASSGGIYGTGDEPFKESAPVLPPTVPLGYYFATKRSSELLLEAYRDVLVGVVLRFFFVYGPDQSAGMLLPRLIDSVRSERPLKLQGEDGILLNPITNTDAARAVESSLALGTSETVNVAGPEVVSLRHIGEAIGELVGIAPRFEVDGAAVPQNLVADIAKMRRLLCSPGVTLQNGLRKMIHGQSEESA